MSSTRQALEDYLAANPDDIAAHSAYADWLTENDDPRGEYIRLLLALENPHLTAGEVETITNAVTKLGKKHQYEWLGSFQKFADVNWWPYQSKGRIVTGYQRTRMVRGWIHELRLEQPSDENWAALLTCPIMRMIQVLNVHCLSSFNTDEPLEWLKYRQKFTALRELAVRWELFGDVHVERLLQLGLVYQLTGLDLSNCVITDDGAAALADDPAVQKLQYLRLHGNFLSPIGEDTLRKYGFDVGLQRTYTPPYWQDLIERYEV